jgi:3-deoxy-D-manno-octulosonic-acid transferase
VHAVSVGETIAAIPLIKALLAEYPHIPLLVTSMTPTGDARVKAAFGDTVLHSYIPYDVPDAVTRFLKRVKPVVAVVMETELWPNLFAKCKEYNIPIDVTNARLSEKSAKGYRSIASLTREMLTAVNVLASQGIADAERFIALGLDAEKVVVTGNLKFDIEVPQELIAKGAALREVLSKNRLIWIAASTHPTEEEIVLAAHRQILEKYPSALLILVPRHPERFTPIAEMIAQQKFKIARRSRNEECTMDTQVYLSDTMGELLLMYSVADVAFVAGSFAPIGGHNMLEAAVLEKPIVVGPQLFNFAEISEMLFAAHGMLKVQNAEGLAVTVMSLFADSNYREQVGKNARKVVDENRGSLKKQVDLITRFVS